MPPPCRPCGGRGAGASRNREEAPRFKKVTVPAVAVILRRMARHPAARRCPPRSRRTAAALACAKQVLSPLRLGPGRPSHLVLPRCVSAAPRCALLAARAAPATPSPPEIPHRPAVEAIAHIFRRLSNLACRSMSRPPPPPPPPAGSPPAPRPRPSPRSPASETASSGPAKAGVHGAHVQA